MTYINHLAREINCKIVYYGPGLCGKTTNLQYVYEASKPDAKGKMISLATDTDRTLFFDFLPLELGSVRGFKVRFHLYTVPGQVFYDASRKLVLRGADGIIFVADSQPSRSEANIESVENLATNLADSGQELGVVPYVIQYNKRDMPDVVSIETLRAQLNPLGVAEFEAAAKSGAGVFETLKGLSRLVLKRIEGLPQPGDQPTR
ncbi:MAG: GTPase domain-containing protein [Nannocystaceae bacterium]